MPYKGMSIAINDAIAAPRDIPDAFFSSFNAMSKLESVDTIEMTRDVKAMSRPGLQERSFQFTSRGK